LSFNNQIFYWL